MVRWVEGTWPGTVGPFHQKAALSSRYVHLTTFGADPIMVGLKGPRLRRARLAESVREQPTAATNVPVLVVPKRCVVRIPAAERHESVIELGSAPSGSK